MKKKVKKYQYNQPDKNKNAVLTTWIAQVNANYHDGDMTMADAIAAAGPRPEEK